MSPRSITDPLVRDAPVLHSDEALATAVRRLLDSALPALPVLDARERYAGIFGEREFMGAVFPGYLKELRSAGFVPHSLQDALEKRSSARHDPVGRHMNTEHVHVGPDHSDAHVAEIFLHHRVLIVPVLEDHRVLGLLTRSDFFRALAERFLEAS
jgi:CBS-domain-containing membrane protein